MSQSSPDKPSTQFAQSQPGARVIAGAPTSITAFVGKTLRGPTDRPVTVQSAAVFNRIFGAPDPAHATGYAVRDFFINGGRRAIVTRLYRPRPGQADTATLPVRGLALRAANSGAWGMKLRARVSMRRAGDPALTDAAAKLGVGAEHLFDLIVRDGGSGQIERFDHVSVLDSSRRVDRVLEAESQLVRCAEAMPGRTPPSAHSGALTDADVWRSELKSTPAATSAALSAVDSAPLETADYVGSAELQSGLHQLDQADLFNLLCIIPDAASGDVPDQVLLEAMVYCARRRAMLIIDGSAATTTLQAAQQRAIALSAAGAARRNAALYVPRAAGSGAPAVTCGLIAGVIARTDAQRGVWRAPAGVEAALRGVNGLTATLTDAEINQLGASGVNGLRMTPGLGPSIWGARTLAGADADADAFKYIPVRRTALFIEESLLRGLAWVVFEPNDEPLWAQIRATAGAFMDGLFRQGAFQGATQDQAYFVQCGRDTNTQADINAGFLNVLIGFAPLRPAEFIALRLRFATGQSKP